MNNTKQIPKYHSQFHPHSTIEYHLIITCNWAAMVKSTGQGMYKTGRIVPVGWHRSACCKWRQNMCRGKTAPAPPFSITQGRIKGAQVHMAAREDLCFRMKNLHKTNKEPFGATAGSKDCYRSQGMWTRECRGCLPLTRPSGCRSFCFLLLQNKKWYPLSCGRKQSVQDEWLVGLTSPCPCLSDGEHCSACFRVYHCWICQFIWTLVSESDLGKSFSQCPIWDLQEAAESQESSSKLQWPVFMPC